MSQKEIPSNVNSSLLFSTINDNSEIYRKYMELRGENEELRKKLETETIKANEAESYKISLDEIKKEYNEFINRVAVKENDYELKIGQLENEKEILLTQKDAIEKKYSELEHSCSQTKEEFSKIKKQYNAFLKCYQELESKHQRLKAATRNMAESFNGSIQKQESVNLN